MTSTHPLDRLRVGMRAVVRHRTGGTLTDALGEVVALDEGTVSVATRRGLQVVPRAAVVAAKEVPPAPVRRGAPHLALSMADLQRLMVDGWPPLERAELGGWVLRAADGFTGRANSVLPLGDPARPLPEAVLAAEAWYAERRLRPMFTLFGPEGFTVADDVLGALLAARGYTVVNRSVVMTAAVASLASTTRLSRGTPGIDGGGDDGGSGDGDLRAAVTVREAPTPWPGWWAASDERRRGSRDLAEAVMARSPEQVLLAAEVDGRTVATARVAFAHAWAGIFGLHVLPGWRRRGVATALMAAAAAQARARRIASVYLQVERTNEEAVRLYRRLGCVTHHEYVYLAAPEPPAA